MPRAPEYVQAPSADTEKNLLLGSLAWLSEVRAGTRQPFEIFMADGLQMATREKAGEIDRKLREQWKEKYPELAKRRLSERLKELFSGGV